MPSLMMKRRGPHYGLNNSRRHSAVHSQAGSLREVVGKAAWWPRWKSGLERVLRWVAISSVNKMQYEYYAEYSSGRNENT